MKVLALDVPRVTRTRGNTKLFWQNTMPARSSLSNCVRISNTGYIDCTMVVLKSTVLTPTCYSDAVGFTSTRSRQMGFDHIWSASSLSS